MPNSGWIDFASLIDFFPRILSFSEFCDVESALLFECMLLYIPSLKFFFISIRDFLYLSNAEFDWSILIYSLIGNKLCSELVAKIFLWMFAAVTDFVFKFLAFLFDEALLSIPGMCPKLCCSFLISCSPLRILCFNSYPLRDSSLTSSELLSRLVSVFFWFPNRILCRCNPASGLPLVLVFNFCLEVTLSM